MIQSDNLTPTTLLHLRRPDRVVPPCCSVSHQGPIGQETAVTALQLLLSDPHRVRPGLLVTTDPVGAGPGVGHFRAERLESV